MYSILMQQNVIVVKTTSVVVKCNGSLNMKHSINYISLIGTVHNLYTYYFIPLQ